jgi:prolyl-tRNA synthetase
VQFQSSEGKLEYAWATSWGVSTRLIGGLIMTHSDDQGLVVPPRLAPLHVVIVPIGKSEAERQQVLAACDRLASALRELPREEFFGYEPISVKVDRDFDKSPGFRFNEWELRGVPARVELGPKDLAGNACVLARRDLPGRESKQTGVPLAEAPTRISAMLKQMQADLFERARKFREANSFEVNSYDEFKQKIEDPGGFLWAHWDGTRETEDKIAAETKATIRCIPFNRAKEPGQCMVTGKPSQGRVVFAKAY